MLLLMGSEFIAYTYVLVNRIDIKAQNVGPFIVNVNIKNLRPIIRSNNRLLKSRISVT